MRAAWAEGRANLLYELQQSNMTDAHALINMTIAGERAYTQRRADCHDVNNLIDECDGNK
jgi:hypothetical protein